MSLKRRVRRVGDRGEERAQALERMGERGGVHERSERVDQVLRGELQLAHGVAVAGERPGRERLHRRGERAEAAHRLVPARVEQDAHVRGRLQARLASVPRAEFAGRLDQLDVVVDYRRGGALHGSDLAYAEVRAFVDFSRAGVEVRAVQVLF